MAEVVIPTPTTASIPGRGPARVVFPLDDNLEYNFLVASDTWTMNHGRGKNPEVIVFDTLGRRGEPWLIDYPDPNTVIVRHTGAMPGRAVLIF